MPPPPPGDDEPPPPNDDDQPPLLALPILRCAFFVPSAGRACGQNVSRRRLVPGHPPLCPQHAPGAESSRVPCPVDPTHTVERAALARHVARCTAALRAGRVAAEPWYRRGANSGARGEEGWETDAWSGPSESEEDEEEEEEDNDGAAAEAETAAAQAARERARPLKAALGAHAGRAKRRAALVAGLGFEGFAALVGRLSSAHARLVAGAHPPVVAPEGWRAASCGGIGGGGGGEQKREEEQQEDEAKITLALRAKARAFDPMMPVDGRHARQHAAIAAVLRERGLLPPQPPPHRRAGGGGVREEVEEDDEGRRGPGEGAGAAPAVLVELGAGKGYMTAWLVLESCARPPPPAAGATAPPPPPPPPPAFRALVLIDAAGQISNKADRRLRGGHIAPLLARVTADLRDVDLARVPGLLPRHGGGGEEEGGRAGGGGGEGGGGARDEDEGGEEGEEGDAGTPFFLAVGKHLCGVATDYALRAFARRGASSSGGGRRGREEEGEAGGEAGGEGEGPPTHPRKDGHGQGRPRRRAGRSSSSRRSAVAVATCCHHRGRWRDFCGRAAWRAAGLSRADFEAALWLCGWTNIRPAAAAASAGPPPEGTPRAWHQRVLAAEAGAGAGAPPAGGDGGADSDDAALGRRCRELLDAARCAWLGARLLGSSGVVEHLVFVGPSVTPENRLILGIAG